MSGFGGNSGGPTAVGDKVSTFVNADLWIFLTRHTFCGVFVAKEPGKSKHDIFFALTKCLTK